MLRERVLGIYPNERKEVVGTQAEVLAASAPNGVYGVCEDTGAVLTRAGDVWVPSATLSFATKEALGSAVAANGGQSLGSSVSVAGETWSAHYGVNGWGYAPSDVVPTKYSMLERITGPLKAVCVGSSTSEQYTVGNLPTDLPAESLGGVFGHAQIMFGSPFYVVRGGFKGFGGVTTGPVETANTVLYQINAALSLPGDPTELIFQPRGNDDFAVISDDQFLRWVEQGIQLWLAAKPSGRVWLIKHHLKVSQVPYRSRIEAQNAWYDLLELRYPGQVYCIDHWTASLLPDGSGPDTSLYRDGTTHLNAAGCIKCARAWESPLIRAGIVPVGGLGAVDPVAFSGVSLLSSNPLFEDADTGAFSSTGWAGSGATFAEGDRDPWGRRSIRLTQAAVGVGGYLRQTYTPSGSQCIARAVITFRPIRACGICGVTVRNSSGSWSVLPMTSRRTAEDQTRAAFDNGRWYRHVSAPFLVDPSFFAANSQLNALIGGAVDASGATIGTETAIADISGLALIKVADAWPT